MYTVPTGETRTPLFSVTLADCEVQTFRSGGKGGQNQNKVESGVRIIHRPSGAIGESREERSQLQNKRNAFRRMGESKRFRLWAKRKVWEASGLMERIDAAVERQLIPRNLKLEVQQPDGSWIVGDSNTLL